MKDIIGIVTVLYNSESVLIEFFETLEQQLFKDFVLYVVDNNSPDNSLMLAEDLSKKVSFKCVFIRNLDNKGVAEGNNQGIKAALADSCSYVLLSNNDIVLLPNTISTLYEKVKTDNEHIITPKIYFHGTDLIWCAGGKFTYFSCGVLHFGYLKRDAKKFNLSKYVEYSPTCFMLIKSNVFDRVGFMDEAYFVYYDDCDFVYRLNSLGYKILYMPTSSLYHKESTSTGGSKSPFTIYYNTRNRVYFSLKYFSFFHRLLSNIYYFVLPLLKKKLLLSSEENEIRSKAIKDGYKLFKSINNIVNKKNNGANF